MNRIFWAALLVAVSAISAFTQTDKDIVSTREMERINWMEFKEAIPSKINTVLLATARSNRTASSITARTIRHRRRWRKRSRGARTR